MYVPSDTVIVMIAPGVSSGSVPVQRPLVGVPTVRDSPAEVPPVAEATTLVTPLSSETVTVRSALNGGCVWQLTSTDAICGGESVFLNCTVTVIAPPPELPIVNDPVCVPAESELADTAIPTTPALPPATD